MLKISLACSLFILSTPAYAASYCGDQKVSSVILSESGIFFTTDKSCPNWCTINQTLSDYQKDRMYSMLLTSASTGRHLIFYFEEATACEAVPVYAHPTNIIYPGN